MDPKTKELVEAAEARAKAVSSGSRVVHISTLDSVEMLRTDYRGKLIGDTGLNGTFFLHAPKDVPALCAVIRELDAKATAAIELIFRYGMIDGSHHKQWCLDQALRLLLGEEYDARIKQENADEDYAPWDEGIAP